MIWRVIGLVSLLWLGACNVMDALGNDELNAQADVILGELGNGQHEAVVARMSSANDPNVIRSQIPQFSAIVPAGPVPAGTVVGVNSQASTDGNIYQVTKTYPYPDRTLRAQFSFIQEAGVWKLMNFNINAEANANGPADTSQPAPAQPGVQPTAQAVQQTPGKPVPVG